MSNRFRSQSSILGILASMTVVVLIAVLAGGVASLDSKIPAVLFIALLLGAVLLLMNAGRVLGIVLVTALIVSGCVQYFGRINQIQWLPSVLAAMMFLRAILDRVRAVPNELLPRRIERTIVPYAVWLLVALLLVAIGSSIAGDVPALQFIAGAKNYFAAWGVMVLVMAARLEPEQLKRIWVGLLVIALLQLPIVVYQHFVVAARRAVASAGYHRPAWDSVVGTFGGDPEGGGASGALALVMVIALVITVSLWKRGLLKVWLGIVGLLVVFLTIVLAEVKVVLVLIPLAILGLFRRTILMRPLMTLFCGALLLLAMIGMASLYQALYWGKSGSREGTAMENVGRAFENALDPYHMDPVSGEVGRLAGIALWARDRDSTLPEKLLGHGLGASRVSPVGVGKVAKRFFPYRVGATAITSILWDVGFIGALLYTLLLLGAAMSALRLSNDSRIPQFHTAVLEALGVSLALVFVTSFYNADALYLPAMGILLSFMIGQVMYWHMRVLPVRARITQRAKAPSVAAH